MFHTVVSMSGKYGGRWLYDAGWFEYQPGLWFPGKKATDTSFGCITRASIEAARNVQLKDTDVFTCTYPKTGKTDCIKEGKCVPSDLRNYL